MGFFDWLGNTISNTKKWIGEKAKDVGNWIGEKVKPILPTIKNVADIVSPLAETAENMGIPLAGYVKKGAEWVSKSIGDGKAEKMLDKIQYGSDVLSGERKLGDVANDLQKKRAKKKD